MTKKTSFRDSPLIDCHAHVWGENMPFVQTAWKKPSYNYSVEEFVKDLDDNGIAYGVIAAASLFGTYNDYSLKALRKYTRLRATAIVEHDIDIYTLEAMHADGFVGIRLQWFMNNSLPDISGDDFQRLCYRLRELGMHIHLNIDGARLVEVAGALIATGVNVLIDHFGWHDPVLELECESYQGMLGLLQHNNAWVKISSGYRHPDEQNPDWSLPAKYTEDLLRRFGPEKLFWGSDSPFIGHEQVNSYVSAIDRYKLYVPDPAVRHAIDQNAYKFYFGE